MANNLYCFAWATVQPLFTVIRMTCRSSSGLTKNQSDVPNLVMRQHVLRLTTWWNILIYKIRWRHCPRLHLKSQLEVHFFSRKYDFKCHISDTLLLDRTEKKATRTAGDPLSDFLVCLLLRELGAYFFTILINDNFLNSATTVDPHVFLIPTG